MAMKKRGPAEENSVGSFNMTPMIDCTFQLIIFFMLVSDISTKQVEPVILPLADAAAKLENREESEVIVNIRKNGDIVIGGTTYFKADPREDSRDEQVKMRKLEEFFKFRRLVEKYWAMPGGTLVNYPLLIRADRSTEWIAIQKILMLVTFHGGVYRTSMGAKKE